MRYVKIVECRVADGAMMDFVNSVQQWERAALAQPAAPLHHAVLIDPDDPNLVLILTEFADRETADSFASTGLLDRFMEGVVQCSVGTTRTHAYELFYATGGEGPRAIFGEQPREV